MINLINKDIIGYSSLPKRPLLMDYAGLGGELIKGPCRLAVFMNWQRIKNGRNIHHCASCGVVIIPLVLVLFIVPFLMCTFLQDIDSCQGRAQTF